MKKYIAVLAVAGLSLGCQSLSYKSPSGETFSRMALGNRLAISELVVEAGADGSRKVRMKGYNSDISEQMEAVAAGAARGAAAGLKP
jgi:hypothetical protein